MLETRINDHRYPALPAQRPIAKPQPEPKPEVVQKQQRPPLDPKIREECYNIFNEVWYDFDEEKGDGGISPTTKAFCSSSLPEKEEGRGGEDG